MSRESHEIHESTLAEPQAAADAAEGQIEQLMAEQPQSPLEAKAALAARQWAEELAHETAADEPAALTVEEAGPAPARWSRLDQWLWGLLLLNLALMGIVLVLPGKQGGEAGAVHPGAPGSSDVKAAPDPFVAPPRQLGALPTGKLWELAVRAAGRDEMGEAIALLEQYLATSKGMSDLERRLVYNQLAHYLIQDGQLERAQEYERKSHQLLSRSYLPEDLLSSAHRAEQEGQLSAMRSAYARFLLQQRQVPPTLRHAIAEAYLKLGDSYRLEAQGGAPPEPPAVAPLPGGKESGHK